MDHTLQKILRKVEAVQLGLLRAEEENEKILLQARAGSDNEMLNCVVHKEEAADRPYRFREVSLIQKDKEDYLYITCKVKEQTENQKSFIMSMEVIRASWFTRKSRGSVSWLQQNYCYEKAS